MRAESAAFGWRQDEHRKNDPGYVTHVAGSRTLSYPRDERSSKVEIMRALGREAIGGSSSLYFDRY